MEDGSLVGRAEEQSANFLSSLGNRWLHVQGVVKLAESVGSILTDIEREYLIAAAYLHDIGYAPALAVTGFHPLDGARYVIKHFDMRLASLVAHHSGARFQAKILGISRELRQFSREQSSLSEALNYCDVTTGPTGQFCSLHERYIDIHYRYGDNHIVARSFERALPSLSIDVSRTSRLIRSRNQRQK